MPYGPGRAILPRTQIQVGARRLNRTNHRTLVVKAATCTLPLWRAEISELREIAVPFNDLSIRLARHRAGIMRAVERVLKSGRLVLGSEVSRFESAFATWVGTSHCVGVANGTDALELSLRSLGINKGDRVATTANAGMYSTAAILAAGAEPVFMDVCPTDLTANCDGVKEAISQGARAVIVTHLYGALCPEIARVAECCAGAGVKLIEDCAQSHGAKFNGKAGGSFGDCGSFSFYPTKNLGAVGDGGAVVTNDGIVASRVRSLRQYGWSEQYQATLSGGRNSRLDEIQAAILTFQLKHLDKDNLARRKVAAAYFDEIRNADIQLPPDRKEASVNHLFVVRTRKRDSLQKWLARRGVGHSIHYPIPDHRQPMFSGKYENLKLPEAESACNEVLSLPCYPGMVERQVKTVIEAINEWRP